MVVSLFSLVIEFLTGTLGHHNGKLSFTHEKNEFIITGSQLPYTVLYRKYFPPSLTVQDDNVSYRGTEKGSAHTLITHR